MMKYVYIVYRDSFERADLAAFVTRDEAVEYISLLVDNDDVIANHYISKVPFFWPQQGEE